MTTTLAGAPPRHRLSRPRLVTALLAISVALNLCFVAGAVWTRFNAPPVVTASERFHRLATTLNLSPEQRTAYDAYVAGMIARSERMRQALDPLLTDAWSEIAKSDPDQAHVLQLLDDASIQRRQFQREALGATLSLLATLTPDQRAAFIANERAFHAAERRRHLEEAR
jgi:Spy/CpxP family protein refolding chaperone